LRAARQGEITLVLSVALALEYEAICSEAEHRLASGLSMREVDVFITALIALTEPVETHFLWRPQLRDPGDEMVLEASVNGRADALVTFNLRTSEPRHRDLASNYCCREKRLEGLEND
jgi:predicted nucleic acid-binding protein